MTILVAVVDGDSVIEYDRKKVLPEQQLTYLDKMDEKMDMGLPSGQGHIFAPDHGQKIQFVANQLILAIDTDDEQLIAASMAYLAIRLPDLKQVSSTNKDGAAQISLIYDRDYAPAQEQEVKFVRPEHLNS
ncbi:hypothetical protein MNBD_GAMMA07-298 [hydrothermal vent metagenome]|uniref:Uncharacterized protein n=1 Tax=hydrothermal vent metagenome TaxID=652676 RepID=A0A3B0WVX1_9ZZZZ